MPVGLLNVQWLNSNSVRAYPLADVGTRRDSTGTIRVPDSFLLSLYFPVHAGLATQPEKFYLQSLVLAPTGITLTIGYDDGTGSPPAVATTSIAKATHREFQSYALPGINDLDDSIGHVVIGKLTDIDLLPAGLYTFLPAATPLEVDAIRPNIRGIASITVVNGSDRSGRVYGDVELVARDNMRIAVSTVDAVTQLAFSAIRGEGLNEEGACVDVVTGEPIRFINGIPPGPDSNFKFTAEQCITIDPIPNGLKFTDTCSSPCCQCSELTALRTQLDRFADGEVTLRTFVTNLAAATAQLSSVILTSRISPSCVES